MSKNISDIESEDEMDDHVLKYQVQTMSKFNETPTTKISSAEVNFKLDNNKQASSSRSSDVLTVDPEIGNESLIRFLKTKVRVLQEDVDRLFQDNHSMMKENSTLEKKIKDVTEIKNQLQQALMHEQKRTDNYTKLFDESKTQISALVTETTMLKKELENANRAQKQSTSNQNSVEVRLNKSLEQIEKYKTLMEKMEQKNKESSSKEQRKFEEAIMENKKLLKQKNDLLTGFKKQMMLIDVLKKQKIHLEAASVLQFTEDEFLKLLNWKTD